MTSNPAISWRGLTRHIRSQFGDYGQKGQQGAAPNRGLLARVRHGLSYETEARAYGDVLPYVEDKNQQQAALRATAIAASHPKLPQSTTTADDGSVVRERKAFGRSCREISIQMVLQNGGSIDDAYTVDPDKPDSIAQRLMQLPSQSMDEAALSINRILTLGDNLGVSVDYFDIDRLLAYWGKGISEESLAVRRSPLRDYYSYVQPKKEN